MALKKIAFFGSIIISLFVINSLIHSIYTLWQKQHLVVRARQDLEKEQQQQQQLQRQLSIVQKPQFVEEEARNKLFLAKPGEGVIVISKDALHASKSGKDTSQDTRPNWKRWWELFFTTTP